MTAEPAADVDRMYTPSGAMAHLVRRSLYGSRVAACGLYPWPSEFLGTGTQAEYERAERLPLCKRCAGTAPDQPEPMEPARGDR